MATSEFRELVQVIVKDYQWLELRDLSKSDRLAASVALRARGDMRPHVIVNSTLGAYDVHTGQYVTQLERGSSGATNTALAITDAINDRRLESLGYSSMDSSLWSDVHTVQSIASYLADWYNSSWVQDTEVREQDGMLITTVGVGINAHRFSFVPGQDDDVILTGSFFKGDVRIEPNAPIVAWDIARERLMQ